jgi:hypothetical protein
MARPLRWFMQEHFYEKPRNVFMQMDVVQVKTVVLDLFLSRPDYKDNHDADVNNYSPKHHHDRQKSVW